MAQIDITSPDANKTVLAAVRSPLSIMILVWLITIAQETARTMTNAASSNVDTVRG